MYVLIDGFTICPYIIHEQIEKLGYKLKRIIVIIDNTKVNDEKLDRILNGDKLIDLEAFPK